jgi:hypothetical protein
MMRDGKIGRNAVADSRAEEPFVRALRKLRTRYEGKSVSTKQMLEVFEGELPSSVWYEGSRSLAWFYDGWINGTALPHVELHSLKFADKDGVTSVSGNITQSDAPNGLVTPVPLYAVAGGKSVLLGRIFAEGATTSFHLSGPAGTRKVVVDPQQTLLTR